MAFAYITEYQSMPVVIMGQVAQVPMEPPLAEQTVVIGAEAKSAAFNASTTLVRVHVDAISSILFGTAPTATTSKQRLPANLVQWHGVPKGASYKVSVISNT